MTAGARRPQPWDRQPGESPQAWEAFQKYRDLGPSRSGAKVGKELGKSQALIDRWSAENAWVLRASAWDAEQDRQWQVELRAAQRKAAEKNVELARTIKIVAGHSLAQLVQNQTALKPNEIARMAEAAIRMEQATFTPLVASAAGDDPLDDLDLDSLTDEEIRHHLLALRRELDAELGDYPDLDNDGNVVDPDLRQYGE